MSNISASFSDEIVVMRIRLRFNGSHRTQQLLFPEGQTLQMTLK